MPEPGYVAVALAVAVSITVALRALPFALRSVLRDSPLLVDLGRWMPLGAVAVLAAYCLASIDLAGPDRGAGELVGVAVTVGVHAWRHNAVLSIMLGAAACLLVSNLLLPGR